MRVPISIAFLLSLAIIGTSWWWFTRDKDFMSPPSEARIEATRQQAQRTTPVPDQPLDAVSAPASTKPAPSPADKQERPSLANENLAGDPKLGEYQPYREKGCDYLIELAQLLQSHGHLERAYLAWERVIDSTTPDARQSRLAIDAIRTIKGSLPVIATKPNYAITLNAGTTANLASRIRPPLETFAQNLESASSGILTVDVQITAGLDNMAAQTSTPVALWFSGNTFKPNSTELASISVSADTDIQTEVDRTLYNILRSHLSREFALTPPPTLTPGDSVFDTIKTRITRLAWHELGKQLNAQP